MNFKNNFSFEKRVAESTKILNKYPYKVPIILEKNNKSSLKKIDKFKFLVSDELTVGQFSYLIRKKYKVSLEESFFFLCGNILLCNTYPVRTIYNAHKDVDGFLYITYNNENVFG